MDVLTQENMFNKKALSPTVEELWKTPRHNVTKNICCDNFSILGIWRIIISCIFVNHISNDIFTSTYCWVTGHIAKAPHLLLKFVLDVKFRG